jgi:hypothetical protein
LLVKSFWCVLITLPCCQLQVENLDRIITMVKNWSHDP